jgi:hypothetical protein
LSLRRTAVDLNAGELHLRATDTKTGRNRTMSVSPALRELLGALPKPA